MWVWVFIINSAVSYFMQNTLVTVLLIGFRYFFIDVRDTREQLKKEASQFNNSLSILFSIFPVFYWQF